ncbi:MAG: hypothetical protein KAT54_01945, partial [Candidatus Marinimicrobia bacterium]|nr:hypothetical protein [Candidatus Neomarinimicrobiota bacterium]
MLNSLAYAAADTVQHIAQATAGVGDSLFVTIMKGFSNLAIPVILFVVVVLGFIKKIKVYET